MEVITHSKEETQALGAALARLLPKGSLIALKGDLAAGKTTFTQGIAKGLNIPTVVNSPTFNILKIYHGDKTLYHIDAYRLEENPYDLGFEEYLDDGIMVVEWFDYIREMFDGSYLLIAFTYVDDNTRKIVLTSEGDDYNRIIEELKVC